MNLLKKLVISFFIFSVLFFVGTTFASNSYACASDSDCGCNQYCGAGFCFSQTGVSCGQVCDYSSGTSCSPGYYYDDNTHNPHCMSTCDYISYPPANACGGLVYEPFGQVCNDSCGAWCVTPGHVGFQCTGNYYCSQDGNCHCRRWCDTLDPDAECSRPFRDCTVPHTHIDGNGYCGDGFPGDSEVCCVPNPDCTQGTTACGAWDNGGVAFNDCSVVQQNRTCTHDSPGDCTPKQFIDHQTTLVNRCNLGEGYACIGNNTCEATITVHVYIDYGHDGSHDANYPFGVVTINNGESQTTGSDGTVTYQKPVGTYTIRYNDNSADYQQVGQTQQTVTLDNNNGDQTVNFRVTPLYKIAGNVFQDKNKDLNYNNNPDALYTGNSTIHVSGGPTAVGDMNQSDGTFDTGEVLQSGTYTVAQTHSLPTGYTYTTPTSWQVTVGDRGTAGPQCNINNSPDAACGNPNDGSIANLNFGVTDENPWKQAVCQDIRNDNAGGTYTEMLPPAPNCGGVSGAYATIGNGSCAVGSGIVYSCDSGFDFTLGSSNVDNWQAGGAGANQECFTPGSLDVIRTSYDYLTTTARESNITPTELDENTNIDPATSCNLANCTLPAALPKGIYHSEGTLYLNAYNFPAPADPTTQSHAYIFLVHGDLHIKGNILIPKGSVAFFTVSGNIYVDKSVGNIITNTDTVANNNPNIEGAYSADGSFVIESYGAGNNVCNADGTPIDKRLVVLGAVITNAAKGGGSVVNDRDLCIYDKQCSSFTAGDGIPGAIDPLNGSDEGLLNNYLFSLIADGQFLLHKVFNWEELKP